MGVPGRGWALAAGERGRVVGPLTVPRQRQPAVVGLRQQPCHRCRLRAGGSSGGWSRHLLTKRNSEAFNGTQPLRKAPTPRGPVFAAHAVSLPDPGARRGCGSLLTRAGTRGAKAVSGVTTH